MRRDEARLRLQGVNRRIDRVLDELKQLRQEAAWCEAVIRTGFNVPESGPGGARS